MELDLFGNEIQIEDRKYVAKVETPQYTPSNHVPHILELCDNERTKRLIRKINESDVDDSEKRFLVEAAHRFSAFNYSKIADYYASASEEMQGLMEDLALVIVDYDDAIERGFVKVQKGIETMVNVLRT